MQEIQLAGAAVRRVSYATILRRNVAIGGEKPLQRALPVYGLCTCCAHSVYGWCRQIPGTCWQKLHRCCAAVPMQRTLLLRNGSLAGSWPLRDGTRVLDDPPDPVLEMRHREWVGKELCKQHHPPFLSLVAKADRGDLVLRQFAAKQP